MGIRDQPQFNVHIQSDLRARMYRYAHKQERSLRWIVDRALTEFLDRADPQVRKER